MSRAAAGALVATILFITLFALTPTVSAERDDCPDVDGDSTEDRIGCADGDGDGWSDPDESWSVADGADAFPTEQTQWSDRAGDGYGDNHEFSALLIDHFPDDEHLHRAVLSVGCTPPDHTLPLGETSHFLCTVKNEAPVPVRIIPSWDLDEKVSMGEPLSTFTLERQGIGGDSHEVRLSFTAVKVGVSGGTFYLNESSDERLVYSIPLGILVETSTPTASSADVSPYIDPIMQQVNLLADKLSEISGVEFSVESALALSVAAPLLLLLIARRTNTSVQRRRARRRAIEEAAANEEERESERAALTEATDISIEEMAADPNPPETKPKRGVRGAEGRVLAEGMVEVMVGEIDMPAAPSDTFNVLQRTLRDSDISGDEWGDALVVDDSDDTEFRVAGHNRIRRTDADSSERELATPTERTRKTKAGKSDADSAETGHPRRTARAAASSSATSEYGDERGHRPLASRGDEVSSDRGDKGSKRKKRSGGAAGKVGHTRGPGIDLK